MTPRQNVRRVFLATLALGTLIAGPATPQDKTTPRPEPVAETRLLMQGINMPNFRGLDTLLRKEPADSEGWTFARGQALLIAEDANLLMLRPPRNQGREAWLEQAAELRKTATRVARAASNRDFAGSRAAFTELANVCNRCHQTFRVAVRVTPFAEESSHPKTAGPSSPPVP